jgi:hypothetical protein
MWTSASTQYGLDLGIAIVHSISQVWINFNNLCLPMHYIDRRILHNYGRPPYMLSCTCDARRHVVVVHVMRVITVSLYQRKVSYTTAIMKCSIIMYTGNNIFLKFFSVFFRCIFPGYIFGVYFRGVTWAWMITIHAPRYTGATTGLDYWLNCSVYKIAWGRRMYSHKRK